MVVDHLPGNFFDPLPVERQERGPVTSEQARAIAESATSGVAGKVEQEDEDGVQVFGVVIQATAGALDVKVRISDGAVTKIEADDAESGDDEGSDSEKE